MLTGKRRLTGHLAPPAEKAGRLLVGVHHPGAYPQSPLASTMPNAVRSIPTLGMALPPSMPLIFDVERWTAQRPDGELTLLVSGIVSLRWRSIAVGWRACCLGYLTAASHLSHATDAPDVASRLSSFLSRCL